MLLGKGALSACPSTPRAGTWPCPHLWKAPGSGGRVGRAAREGWEPRAEEGLRKEAGHRSPKGIFVMLMIPP